jgi:hypothetical protein
MAKRKLQKTTTIPTDLIAPCGMNCRLCWGYVRDKNACPGCLRNDGQESKKSQYRSTCKIRNCKEITQGKTKQCSEKCDKFPCARLKQLDQRYRTRYGMSMIENLQMIHAEGIRCFIRHEKEKWACPDCGDMICVHKPKCLSCGYKWHRDQTAR